MQKTPEQVTAGCLVSRFTHRSCLLTKKALGICERFLAKIHLSVSKLPALTVRDVDSVGGSQVPNPQSGPRGCGRAGPSLQGDREPAPRVKWASRDRWCGSVSTNLLT